ncbi:MAG TPA: CDP-alcohol phosphatidyltransferase family protein [Acidimicrobiia bacterium]|jgi:phosphatidylserine synthase|nr:CDP-alcohol phosphatidyltransferase family protein [Acidimicrobiia bacterium]
MPSTSVRTARPPTFRLKDLFTLVNLLSGVVAVHYVVAGQLERAGYAVHDGYLGGDLLDGAVARMTRTGNRFGAEFDSIVDHFVHVVVPGLIIYTAYRRGGHELVGLFLMGTLVATATIRHARLAAERFDFPLCWCGLPRTISGFVAMSYPLSHTFFTANSWRYTTGAFVVVPLCVLNLVPIPYMTHRGNRGMQPWAKALVAAFIAAPAVMFVFDRPYLFDVFFVATAGYALTGWFPVRPEERRAFYAEYRRWSAALAG